MEIEIGKYAPGWSSADTACILSTAGAFGSRVQPEHAQQSRSSSAGVAQPSVDKLGQTTGKEASEAFLGRMA